MKPVSLYMDLDAEEERRVAEHQARLEAERDAEIKRIEGAQPVTSATSIWLAGYAAVITVVSMALAVLVIFGDKGSKPW